MGQLGMQVHPYVSVKRHSQSNMRQSDACQARRIEVLLWALSKCKLCIYSSELHANLDFILECCIRSTLVLH